MRSCGVTKNVVFGCSYR